METADVLEQAAEVLEQNGWAQGTLAVVNGDGTGSYCAMGAVRKALGYFDHEILGQDSQEFRRICYQAAIADLVMANYLGTRVARWNDEVAADKFEVIDMLKLAAKDLRNQKTE